MDGRKQSERMVKKEKGKYGLTFYNYNLVENINVIRNAIRVSKADVDRVKVWFLIHQVADSHL